MRRWWTEGDSAQFHTAAEPLMKQVAAYQPLPGVAVAAEATQIEDVADLAGLMAAFDAHRAALGRRRSDAAYVKQQDRVLPRLRPELAEPEQRGGAAGTARLGQPHAGSLSDRNGAQPGRVVRGLRRYPGQRLYLEPHARVRVW